MRNLLLTFDKSDENVPSDVTKPKKKNKGAGRKRKTIVANGVGEATLN